MTAKKNISKMSLAKFFVVSAFVLVGAQNCGKVQFSSQGELVSKTEIAPDVAPLVGDTQPIANIPVDQPQLGTPEVSDGPEEYEAPPMSNENPPKPPLVVPPSRDDDSETEASTDSNSDGDKDYQEDKDGSDEGETTRSNENPPKPEQIMPPPRDDEGETTRSNENPPKPVLNQDNDLSYVCVLDGPGKSTKLAFKDSLQAKEGTPTDVCMSKYACLNIVSKSFKVKSAEFRGFCKTSSAETVRMSDEVLRMHINKSLEGE